jgi:hypothetical protein
MSESTEIKIEKVKKFLLDRIVSTPSEAEFFANAYKTLCDAEQQEFLTLQWKADAEA